MSRVNRGIVAGMMGLTLAAGAGRTESLPVSPSNRAEARAALIPYPREIVWNDGSLSLSTVHCSVPTGQNETLDLAAATLHRVLDELGCRRTERPGTPAIPVSLSLAPVPAAGDNPEAYRLQSNKLPCHPSPGEVLQLQRTERHHHHGVGRSEGAQSGVHPAHGGTIHINHFFGFPGHVPESKPGTVYALTYIHSPQDSEVPFWIGFNENSRAGGRRSGPNPAQGQWSIANAKVWINAREVPNLRFALRPTG